MFRLGGSDIGTNGTSRDHASDADAWPPESRKWDTYGIPASIADTR
jgi:hypothetical protein